MVAWRLLNSVTIILILRFQTATSVMDLIMVFSGPVAAGWTQEGVAPLTIKALKSD